MVETEGVSTKGIQSNLNVNKDLLDKSFSAVSIHAKDGVDSSADLQMSGQAVSIQERKKTANQESKANI